MDNNKNNSTGKDIDLDSLISYYSANDKKTEKSQKPSGTEPQKDSVKPSQKLQNNDDDEKTRSMIPEKTQNQKKKFVVRITDDDFNYSDSSDSQKPADSSSVYFSNYKGRNVSVVRPAAQQEQKNNVNKQNNKNQNTSKNTDKEKKGKPKKKKKSIGSSFAIILFVLIIVITSAASYVSITTINDILAVTSSDDVVEVKVYKKNANGEDDLTSYLSYDEIIDILAENNLITQKGICKLFAKFRHLDSSEYKFKPGIYSLRRSMGVEGMLYKCLQQNRTNETVTVSFPEGWTIMQMFEKLEKNKVCTAKSLYSVLDGYLDMHSDDYPFLKGVPQSEDRYQVFEGYLFPDTYDFYIDSDPNFVIDKMFNSFNAHWTEEYQTQAAKLGYSMDEILIIASIIQREAADSSQMKDVSSVLHNRLKDSIDYGNLGCDSTEDYIEKFYDTSNFAVSHQNYYFNLYSTHKVTGLPPGPICNPGIDAIEAALHPADTNYYFFQHDDNGKIYLAESMTQFNYDQSVINKINAELKAEN